MRSVKYLDGLICIRGLENGAELYRHMGWPHSAVHNYRNGIRFMDSEKRLRVT